ncbi:hypothetical protein BH20ACT1_BH20ACT1_06400 [soil metagenome]
MQDDPRAKACYLELSTRPVGRTVHLNDGVMVDVDDAGDPVGVEFLWARDDIPSEALMLVVQRFPALGARLLREALAVA